MEEKHTLGNHISSADKYAVQPPIQTSEGNEEFDKLKGELEEFKKKLVKKFPFALALSILPAPSFKAFEEDEGLLAEEIARKPLHVMFIIPEDEYKNIAKKIKPGILELVKEGKHNVWVHIKTPVDVWNYGMDSKFEFLDAIAASYPLHDKGFLGTLRLANIHKTLVLRKFEKYVATYAVGGSLVRGTADKDSDVDTFVVIDDTDVKKMPRLQLLERLRGYIYDYIKEATALAGVKNVLNVQVYLLTDFWQSVKDATPVIFTFIRDGIPMYDRGTFLPWKLLLKMGKIKPSPEAVDTFMKYGDQNDTLVKRRLMDAMIDIYWGVVTPTQALMMLAGQAPPVPKTIVEDVKKEFVHKEKIMGLKELKILEKTVKLYKDYEHGKLTSITGEEIDTLLKEAGEYDKKLKVLRQKLESRVAQHSADAMYEEMFSILKNILGNHPQDALMKLFEKKLVKEGKISPRYSPILKSVSEIRKKARSKKFTQNDLDEVRRNASDLMNVLIEYSQRKEIALVERGIVQIGYNGKVAELVLTDEGTFFVEAGKVYKIGAKLEEVEQRKLEEALTKTKDRTKLKLSHKALETVRKERGEFDIFV